MEFQNYTGRIHLLQRDGGCVFTFKLVSDGDPLPDDFGFEFCQDNWHRYTANGLIREWDHVKVWADAAGRVHWLTHFQTYDRLTDTIVGVGCWVAKWQQHGEPGVVIVARDGNLLYEKIARQLGDCLSSIKDRLTRHDIRERLDRAEWQRAVTMFFTASDDDTLTIERHVI